MSNSDISGKLSEGFRTLSSDEFSEKNTSYLVVDQENSGNYIANFAKIAFSAAWVYLCKEVAEKYIDNVKGI